MNAQQQQYLSCLTILATVAKYNATGACAAYWEKTIKDAMGKKVKPIGTTGGAIQSTLSNPLAYFVVPMFEHACAHIGLRKPVTRGRTLEQATAQFVRACRDGLTNRADKALRLSNDMTVEELAKASQYARDGLAIAFLKVSSRNEEIRGSLNRQSALARKLREVPELEQAHEELEL